jgi:hypothetical protein
MIMDTRKKELESLRETIEVMCIFPKLEKDIEKAEKEYKDGHAINFEDLLLKEGFVLPGKSKK